MSQPMAQARSSKPMQNRSAEHNLRQYGVMNERAKTVVSARPLLIA